MSIALLYVSRSNLRLPDEEGEVDAIVGWSQARNATLDVTGGLVFTERNFAQYLEGPEEAVDALMESIGRDARHRELEVIFRRPLRERLFPTWALAYAGPSTFVAAHVLSVVDEGASPGGLKAAQRLVAMMRQFVDAHLVEQRRKQAGAPPPNVGEISQPSGAGGRRD
jgi:hypothetical protein